MRRKFGTLFLAGILGTVLVLGNGMKPVTTEAASNSNQVIVVLDPGHDSKHVGAAGNGFHEEVLVLKIGLYAKEALENNYDNVKVVMTREDGNCPFPNPSSSRESVEDNAKRTQFAASQNADFFVSLHLNSGGASNNGAIILAMNENWIPEYNTYGKKMGNLFLKELGNLGLRNGGFIVRDHNDPDHPDENYYEDGSVSDYYGILRNAKLNHVPAIIVEHGFITSTTDIEFFNTDAKLKAVGEADARAIAQYFELGAKGSNKTPVKPTDSTKTTQASSNSGNDGNTSGGSDSENAGPAVSIAGNAMSEDARKSAPDAAMVDDGFLHWQQVMKEFFKS